MNAPSSSAVRASGPTGFRFLPLGAAAALLLAWGLGEAAAKTVTVILRYDDYSERSDTKLETRLIEVLRRHKACCTFGVIPFVSAGDWRDPNGRRLVPLGEDKSRLLRDAAAAGVVEVALHGWSHQTARGAAQGHPAEFQDIGRAEQLRRLVEGKQFLERRIGCRISVFVPPWNAYDADTVAALAAADIPVISASPAGIVADGERVIPETCGLRELQGLVRLAERSDDDAPLVVCLLHEAELRDGGPSRSSMSVDELDRLLAWLAAEDRVRISTMARALGELDLTAERYAHFVAYRRVSRLGLGVGQESRVYWSRDQADGLRQRSWPGVIGLHGGLAAVAAVLSFGLSAAVVRRRRRLAGALAAASAGVLVAAAVYLGVLHAATLDVRGLGIISACLGVCLGACLYRLRLRRPTGTPRPADAAPPTG